MHHKVTIVGGGQTGGAVAQRLSEIPYLNVVILDTNEGLPQGKALDLAETAALIGFGGRITGSNDWEESGRFRYCGGNCWGTSQARNVSRRSLGH